MPLLTYITGYYDLFAYYERIAASAAQLAEFLARRRASRQRAPVILRTGEEVVRARLRPG
jgi:hypothetical protein